MLDIYYKFIPLYDSIKVAIQPSLEEKKRVGIKIEDMLKQADALRLEIHENEIELLLSGLITYFRDLGITAEKSEYMSGEMFISFKKASEEEKKYGIFLDVYTTLGNILQNYRQKLPYVIPESKFPGTYKILEETFEEILASKKPFAIYTNDLLKFADNLIPKELRDSTTPEFFLEGLQWYLEKNVAISMNISPLISMEKGDLIVDILIFEQIG